MTSKKQQSPTYLSLGVTSIQSFPIRTTGQLFLHSCLNWTSRSELLWHVQHYYHQYFHMTHHIVSLMHKSTWEGNHLISHLHLLGLHLSVETMAILVSLSCSSSCCFFLGGIPPSQLRQGSSLGVCKASGSTIRTGGQRWELNLISQR